MSNKELFIQNWNNFLSEVRGKLLMTARTQDLSLPLANLLVDELATYWLSPSDVKGAWLARYRETHPKEGEVIAGILKEDMKLVSQEAVKTLPDAAKYLLPLAGGMLGLGMSLYWDATKTVRTVATLVPMLAVFALLDSYQKKQRENNRKRVIDGYIRQLKKCETSICTIIKD